MKLIKNFEKVIGLAVFLNLFFLPFALAHETTIVLPDPGTTPDSPLWGLDLAIEKIELALTFDNAAKAEKRLQNARERLAEVKAMVDEKKMDKAEEAELERQETLKEAEQNTKEIEDPEQELKGEVEIEKELEDHGDAMQKIKIDIEGQLTQEQRAQLDALVKSFGANADQLKIKVEQDKGETKIELKTKTGKSDKEIENLEQDIENSIDVERSTGVENALNRSQENIERFQQKHDVK